MGEHLCSDRWHYSVMPTTEPSICPSVSCPVVFLSFTPLHSFFQLIALLYHISQSLDLARNNLVSHIPVHHFYISITEGELRNNM